MISEIELLEYLLVLDYIKSNHLSNEVPKFINDGNLQLIKEQILKLYDEINKKFETIFKNENDLLSFKLNFLNKIKIDNIDNKYLLLCIEDLILNDCLIINIFKNINKLDYKNHNLPKSHEEKGDFTKMFIFDIKTISFLEMIYSIIFRIRAGWDKILNTFGCIYKIKVSNHSEYRKKYELISGFYNNNNFNEDENKIINNFINNANIILVDDKGSIRKLRDIELHKTGSLILDFYSDIKIINRFNLIIEESNRLRSSIAMIISLAILNSKNL